MISTPNTANRLSIIIKNRKQKKLRQLRKEALSKGLKGGKMRKYVFKHLHSSTECVDISDESYLNGIVVKIALKQLDTLIHTGKTFFLAVGFNKPHLLFVAPKKYRD